MSAEMCLECKFFDFRPKLGDGYCMRYPPTVVMGVSPCTLFPIVQAADYCGEFKQKEIKVDE